MVKWNINKCFVLSSPIGWWLRSYVMLQYLTFAVWSRQFWLILSFKVKQSENEAHLPFDPSCKGHPFYFTIKAKQWKFLFRPSFISLPPTLSVRKERKVNPCPLEKKRRTRLRNVQTCTEIDFSLTALKGNFEEKLNSSEFVFKLKF